MFCLIRKFLYALITDCNTNVSFCVLVLPVQLRFHKRLGSMVFLPVSLLAFCLSQALLVKKSIYCPAFLSLLKTNTPLY